ncbi:pentatricopeptide repeat-containing protein At3g26630, chloroplastic-like [Phoenix dactylifera]|uniref:Pentatricopeptide repeat-containing protein At3g26630, chloroplastic-like n=1 Tax=Phoenix dactylifera TaxID=42345 RepID=A0A8B7D1X1_PHODC|nr:pentatricopeptide repeat-containing protein At3g26630, chloroplastic-like [Phoenix dactylifera]
MVSCLGCAIDPLPQRRLVLGPRDALRLLNQSKNPKQLKQLHARILRAGLSRDPAVLAALLRLYSSHRRLDLASRLFSAFPHPPTIAWNLMIRAHAAADAPREALLHYNRMIASGVRPDKFTFPFAVKACSSLSNVLKGKEVHAFAIKLGFFLDPFVQNALIHLYLTCGDSESGRKVFDGMRAKSVVSWTALISGLVACGNMEAARAVFDAAPVRNVVTWTAMIDGCARNGRADEAFELFQRMLEDGARPNEFTVVALSIACTELGCLSLGRWVHELARKNGGLERSVYVGTALVDMYSKCGSLEDAARVFGQMRNRSSATWNSMITSLGVHGRGKEAVAVFREMGRTNVKPDGITFVGVLSACAREGMVEEGFRLFAHMVERYGIAPLFEHYSCLAQLLGCANSSNGGVEMVKNLMSKFDARARQMVLEACRMNGNVRLEEVLGNGIRDLELSDGSVGLTPIECRSIEREVG